MPGCTVAKLLKAADGDQVVIAIRGSEQDPNEPVFAVMRADARNRVLAKAGAEMEVVTRLTDGTFPNFRRLCQSSTVCRARSG